MWEKHVNSKELQFKELLAELQNEHFSSNSMSSAGYHFDTEDDDRVLPGFLNSIIGIQQAEKKAFPLAFPDSWRQENLRGVNALFTVSKQVFFIPP